MSAFTNSFNQANDAFEGMCAETFELIRLGIPGTYTAVSIDDLNIANAIIPGGSGSENQVNVFIKDAVVDAAGIVEGTVLAVRGKRVRVASINEDGDNTQLLVCGPAGVSL